MVIPQTESPRRTRVKMCGTTRLDDALAAVQLGIDALGFIFYRKSPRYVAPEAAASIITRLPPFVDRVGVFVDAPLAEVVQTAAAGLSYLQLHGEESPEYCREIRARLPFLGIIKAVRVGEDSRGASAAFAPYADCVNAFLLDTYVKGESGGTGRVFPWSIIATLHLQRPVILAGGLGPENIARGLIEVRPYGVDINSGVELRPGIKDHHRLGALMQVVAQAACR
jgi:phosphoribosylanthranilate isomerase